MIYDTSCLLSLWLGSVLFFSTSDVTKSCKVFSFHSFKRAKTSVSSKYPFFKHILIVNKSQLFIFSMMSKLPAMSRKISGNCFRTLSVLLIVFYSTTARHKILWKVALEFLSIYWAWRQTWNTMKWRTKWDETLLWLL